MSACLHACSQSCACVPWPPGWLAGWLNERLDRSIVIDPLITTARQHHINPPPTQSVDMEALFQEVFKGGKTEADFMATVDGLEAWCVWATSRSTHRCAPIGME